MKYLAGAVAFASTVAGWLGLGDHGYLNHALDAPSPKKPAQANPAPKKTTPVKPVASSAASPMASRNAIRMATFVPSPKEGKIERFVMVQQCATDGPRVIIIEITKKGDPNASIRIAQSNRS